MPRNVRNFWLELEVDGRRSVVKAGPASKTGGFILRVKVRNAGEIDGRELEIRGRADESGKLTIDACALADGNYCGSRAVLIESKR